jgi:hypothetical protein
MSDPGDNTPSIGQDAPSTRSMGGAFGFIFKKLMQNTDGMLPCKVIAATTDGKRDYVKVQPLVQMVGTGGTKMDRAQIAKVPCLAMGAGNWVMSFPSKPDDLGWIIASDRDISLYLQANATAPPNTARIHSFEDGLFVPDKARQWTLAGADADKAVWQSLDGTTKVTLGTDKISIVHPTLVELTTPHGTVKSGDWKVEKGIAFWNHAVPGSQPAVTGALSAVTDGNAKAVLTSLKNIMVACGQATDGTT